MDMPYYTPVPSALLTRLTSVRVSPYPEDIHPLQKSTFYPQAWRPLRRRQRHSKVARTGQATGSAHQQCCSRWHLGGRRQQGHRTDAHLDG